MAQQRKKKKSKKKSSGYSFSKWLLVQESLLIWIITIACLILAFISIIRQSYGELPWITAMVGCPWTAYGVSQAFYYRKSMAENTKNGITFESAMGNIPDIPEVNIPSL